MSPDPLKKIPLEKVIARVRDAYYRIGGEAAWISLSDLPDDSPDRADAPGVIDCEFDTKIRAADDDTAKALRDLLDACELLADGLYTE